MFTPILDLKINQRNCKTYNTEITLMDAIFSIFQGMIDGVPLHEAVRTILPCWNFDVVDRSQREVFCSKY